MRETETDLIMVELHRDVRVIHDRLFIGADGRPSMQEDIATMKGEIKTLSTKKPAIPSAVWKGLGAVLLAIATILGGYVGVSSETRDSGAARK